MNDTAFRIKQLREEKNLSVPKLAANIAVESYVVRDTENRKQRPSQDLILKYAEYFGVKLDWLMTGEGEKYAKADKSHDVREPAADYVMIKSVDLNALINKMNLIESELREIKKAVAA